MQSSLVRRKGAVSTPSAAAHAKPQRGLISRLVRQALDALVMPAMPRSPLNLEALEPRLLLSGDPLGARVNGSLDVAGETDRYSFTLTEDLRIVFDSLTNNGNLRWSLDGPQGALVGARQFSASDSVDFNGAVAMDLTPGDYTVTVDGSGETTGAYSFRLLDTARATVITPGQGVSGVLDAANETDVYRVSAAAGQRLFFDRQASAGDAYWRVLDPFGRVAQGPVSMGSDGGPFVAEFDGVYALLIEGRAYTTGTAAYRFALQTVQDIDRNIVLGQADDTPANWVSPGAPGNLGGALQLNGQQQLQVAPAPSLDLSRTITLETWVKVDQFQGTWTPLFYKGNGLYYQRGYAMWLNADGSVQLDSSDGGVESVQTAAGLVNAGEWHHVAGVIDRADGAGHGTLRILIDGVERASGSVRQSNALLHTGVALRLGNDVDEGFSDDVAALRGTLDEVRVWNVARSNAQIADAKNAPLAGNEAGLVLYLPLNQTSGNAPADASPAAQSVQLQPRVDGALLGSIYTPGSQVRHHFEVSTATRLYIDSLTHDSTLRWALSGPQGVVASARSFQSTDSADGSAIFDLVAGAYTLTVSAVGDSTAPFALRLLDLAGATAIVRGVLVSGSLQPARETTAYRFDGNAGERIFIDNTVNTGGDTYWRLLDPYGRVLVGPTGIGNDIDVTTLPYAGSYTLLVEGRSYNSAARNDHSFTVHTVQDGAQALVPDGRVDGALTQPGQRQTYTFALASAGQWVFDSLSNDSLLAWTLTGPLGAVVSDRRFNSSDSAHIGGSTLLSLAAGDYSLVIDGIGARTGAFAFGLLNPAADVR